MAVVGSGPAGFYAAGALLDAETPIEVDMLERLPTPWGLVRLGVAPDHPKLKTVSRAFERIALKPGFRFFGNVEVGRDLTHADLTRLYDAVVYAFGAQSDRRLDIPGEDLPGSWSATEFVAWYNGHPDFQELQFDLNVERAVVIGNGNVALDVARMLALTPAELEPTDTTDPAIEAIGGATIRDIVVVGRRGPAQASWTTPELKELGELAGADVVVDPAELELDAVSEASLEDDTNARRNLEVLRDFAAREPTGKPVTVRLRFLVSPVALHGDEKVQSIELVRNRLEERDGRLVAVPDRRARDDRVRSRLSERRLPRRRPAGASLRRAARDDSKRARPRRGRRRRARRPYVLRRLDQARPDRDHRHEQEGRDRDGRPAARGRRAGEVGSP